MGVRLDLAPLGCRRHNLTSTRRCPLGRNSWLVGDSLDSTGPPFKVCLPESLLQGLPCIVALTNVAGHLGAGQEVITLQPQAGTLAKFHSTMEGVVSIVQGRREGDEDGLLAIMTTLLVQPSPRPSIGQSTE